jgi:hypothetical protein
MNWCCRSLQMNTDIYASDRAVLTLSGLIGLTVSKRSGIVILSLSCCSFFVEFFLALTFSYYYVLQGVFQDGSSIPLTACR